MRLQDLVSEHADARILVVDDHEASAAMIERVLRAAGYNHVTATSEPRKVLALFKDVDPDILLLDIRMPHIDGFTVMRQVTARHSALRIPILVITGESESSVKEQALANGASDFLQKPFDATEVVLRVRNLLKTRVFTTELETEVRRRTAQLKRAETEVAQRLALVAELRDYQSGEHTQRVGTMSALMAEAMGVPADQVEAIRLAAPLHDIGKIAIPDDILLKQGPLTIEEFEVVKQHTSVGARMLSGSESWILQHAEEIALYHHENWDGTGYTPGLEGDMIPVSARIVRVADVFDALIHERPYKEAWAIDEAIELINDGAGTTFDPEVVSAFVRVQATEGLPRLGGGTAGEPEPDRPWGDVSRPSRLLDPLAAPHGSEPDGA